MNTPANDLPDAQTAYNNLFEGIHNEVFFRKCAAAGFPVRSAEEAQWMLETAGKLEAVSQADQVKQAAAQDNPYFQMNSRLDDVLTQYGLNGHKKAASAQEVKIGYKQAAAELMQDPVLYNSVLALAAHEAAQQQQEFQAWQGNRA